MNTQTAAAGAHAPAEQRTSRRRFLLALVAIVAILAMATLLVLLVPGLFFVVVAPQAGLVINTAAVLVAALVAGIAWIRYRETAEADSLLQAAAFLALFGGGAIPLGLVLIGEDVALGFDVTAPGQAPLYLWTAKHLMAAPLLLAGAVTILRAAHPAALQNATRESRQPTAAETRGFAVALAPVVWLIALGLAIVLGREALPALIPSANLEQMLRPAGGYDPSLASGPMHVIQMGLAAVYLAAAVAYARVHDRFAGKRPYFAYLAAGLVAAAFAQIHFVAVPAPFEELLSAGDILRLCFYALVGVGIAAATRQDLADLRAAGLTIGRLSEAENERIALAERARLAREIHDGLVQDLWLARLTHGRLAQLLDAADNLSEPEETRQLAARIDSILEDALAEARQAVVTLQPRTDETFGSLLRRVVEDYGDRFGLEVECSLEGPPVQLSRKRQAQVLRICREALNNVRKHADASLVRVSLESDDSLMRLIVADNGRGFDPASVERRGYGMQGMYERAAEIDGRLRVDSAPMDGTRVVLELNADEVTSADGT